MGKRISVVFLLSVFTLLLFAGGALGAKKAGPPFVLPVDGAQPPQPQVGPLPVMYEPKAGDCEDIFPDEMVADYVGVPVQVGMTYYDYQKNGSMGRMIAVGPGGHKHIIFHETRGVYPTFPRYVTYNCHPDPYGFWCNGSMGGQIDGGDNKNAGYAQMLVEADGRAIALYHRTAGAPYNSCLRRGDEGTICQGNFSHIWDFPDNHEPDVAGAEGSWPKGCIVTQNDTTYIHIVTSESSPAAADDQSIAYQRCKFEGTNLRCCTPTVDSCYTIPQDVCMSAADYPVTSFANIATISAIPVSSPVSKKVAIVYTQNRADNQVNNDIIYIESDSNGTDWLDGFQWPPTKINVTDYPAGDGPRAYCDVAACYDYNDNLHIVWNAHDLDSIGGTVTYAADLYHWTDIYDSITMVAAGPSDGIAPGAWNRTISKMSISTKDPIYHPGGDPDSVFLFCTWTQFNEGDVSQGSYTNGDIYASLSNDGGETWTPGFNLTGTKTDGCAPGECLSEHWSSLAENMYNGDLHIEYVCDRDAGGIVQDEGVWTDNPMMYLHVEQLPYIRACGQNVSIVDPVSFTVPPIKVPLGGERIIEFQVTGIYNLPGHYQCDATAGITFTQNQSGYLDPGQTKAVLAKITCGEEDEFINGTITVYTCDTSTVDADTFELKVYAVCSEDYYECKRDPATKIDKDNCVLKLWACVNSEEWVWDKRVATATPDDTCQVIFSGGVIVATTADGGAVKAVGRQDYSDTRTGARDTFQIVQGSIEPYTDEPCTLQKVHVTNTYMWTPNLDPPNDFRWWWIDIHKQILMFHGPDCPEWKKEQVIKYVWITKSQYPVWWPQPGEQIYENIYYGVFADIDAPFDDECNGCNSAGYENDLQIAWQRGWWNDTLPDGHQEYDGHYVGLAFTDPTGAVVVPIGMQNVRNDSFLYPQNGWGWLEDELYDLAATPGNNIHDPDSVVDRTVVMTAGMIPGGTEPFDEEFILIEASIPGENEVTGLAELREHIIATRALMPGLADLGLFSRDFPICGDADNNGAINVTDIVKIINYLFQEKSPPPWPITRADCDGNCSINVTDVVCMINYLFQEKSPPNCCGFGR